VVSIHVQIVRYGAFHRKLDEWQLTKVSNVLNTLGLRSVVSCFGCVRENAVILEKHLGCPLSLVFGRYLHLKKNRYFFSLLKL
jgi:hypothetical protein